MEERKREAQAQEQHHSEELSSDDNDVRSVGTVVPHELERADERTKKLQWNMRTVAYSGGRLADSEYPNPLWQSSTITVTAGPSQDSTSRRTAPTALTRVSTSTISALVNAGASGIVAPRPFRSKLGRPTKLRGREGLQPHLLEAHDVKESPAYATWRVLGYCQIKLGHWNSSETGMYIPGVTDSHPLPF